MKTFRNAQMILSHTLIYLYKAGKQDCSKFWVEPEQNELKLLSRWFHFCGYLNCLFIMCYHSLLFESTLQIPVSWLKWKVAKILDRTIFDPLPVDMTNKENHLFLDQTHFLDFFPRKYPLAIVLTWCDSTYEMNKVNASSYLQVLVATTIVWINLLWLQSYKEVLFFSSATLPFGKF